MGEGVNWRHKSRLLRVRHLQAYLSLVHSMSPNKDNTMAPLCSYVIYANVRHHFLIYSVIIVCDVRGINYGHWHYCTVVTGMPRLC